MGSGRVGVDSGFILLLLGLHGAVLQRLVAV